MRLAWAEFFKTYDLLLCPVAGTAAFPHDQHGERHERTLVVNGKRVPVTDHLFWAGYTGASYLPATAAPCGLTRGGLPVGMQIVGPQIRRSHVPGVREAARARVPGVRAAAGVRVRSGGRFPERGQTR